MGSTTIWLEMGIFRSQSYVSAKHLRFNVKSLDVAFLKLLHG